MTEHEFMADFLRDELKALREKKKDLLSKMGTICEEDENVRNYVGLLSSPGVRDYIKNQEEVTSINESIDAKKEGYRYHLKSICEHPAFIYRDTAGENWLCQCLVCKETVFRLPEDIIDKTVIVPTLYGENINIDDISNEYLDLKEDINEEATDIIVKKYNRITKKR